MHVKNVLEKTEQRADPLRIERLRVTSSGSPYYQKNELWGWSVRKWPRQTGRY